MVGIVEVKYVIDFETRSEVDLLKEGLMKYATHPSTDILMLGYKQFDSPVTNLWLPGQAMPFDLNCHTEDMFYAFNAEFELAIWNYVGVKKYKWQPLELKNLTCLSALANRYGLPNSMGDVAEALRCMHQKNPEGKELIQVFCTPKHGWPPHSDPRYARFKQYCVDDILAEEDILRKLPAQQLSEEERWVWEYTVHMNQRGIPIDVKSAKQIRRLSEQYREGQFELLSEMTNGEIRTINQIAKIKKYCADRGCELEDLTAYTVQKTLEEDLPDEVATILEMRSALGMSSIGKYIRMEDMQVSGRVYNSQRYYGAHTGRWTGSGVQLLNLPRAAIGKGIKDEAQRVAAVEDEIQKYFDGRIVDENPIQSARALIRPMVMAEEGKMLAAADYSSIEYVVLEWFAGDYEKLARFAKGLDPYIDLAAKLYGLTYEQIDDIMRQLGKVGILGCGYGSGWATLQTVADRSYGVKLTDKQAQDIVNTYRTQHKKVSTMWYKLADAAVQAVDKPGTSISLYHVTFKVVKDNNNTVWLTIQLPSGRRLFYMSPFLEAGSRGPVVCHYGFIQKIKKFGVMRLIPGRIAENIVQAASRDILVHGMQNCKREGLDVIWTCYDEVIIECPEDKAKDHYNRLVTCMCDLPEWAKEIPVKADGFIAKRYKKN